MPHFVTVLGLMTTGIVDLIKQGNLPADVNAKLTYLANALSGFLLKLIYENMPTIIISKKYYYFVKRDIEEELIDGICRMLNDDQGYLFLKILVSMYEKFRGKELSIEELLKELEKLGIPPNVFSELRKQ